MGQGDFNLDMELYLADRKKGHHQKESPREKVHHKEAAEEKEFEKEEKEYISKKSSFGSKMLNFITGGESPMKEEEKAEIKEEEKELEEYSGKKGKSLFGTIKSWLSFDEDNDTEVKEDAAEEKREKSSVPEDIKEALKIQNRWMMKLPAKELKEFKASEDYKLYKEILKKHNLIKEK